MWTGGAERQSVDRIRWIRWIRGNSGMEPFFRVLGIQNNENENPISKLSILLCFLLVFVINFSCSLCFTMILDAFLLKSCSKAAPAALGGCGGLGQLWEALAELWEALPELWEALYIQKLPINRTSGRYVNRNSVLFHSLAPP